MNQAPALGDLLLARARGAKREGASYAWQTTMRWMLYFLPQRYGHSVPSYSEILVRREGNA